MENQTKLTWKNKHLEAIFPKEEALINGQLSNFLSSVGENIHGIKGTAEWQAKSIECQERLPEHLRERFVLALNELMSYLDEQRSSH